MTRLRALAAAILAAAAGLLAAPPPAAAVTCAPAAVTAPAVVWDLAHDRLTALIPGTGFPFGRTGRSAYVRTGAHSWTSGFFPASLWMLYRQSGDPEVLDAARRLTDALAPVSAWKGTHDLGFMVGLPMTLALENDPDATRRERYRAALVTAARSLATRWNPRVEALRSAYYTGQWGVIIDSAMNAPLLIDVGTRLGGTEGGRLSQRGVQHMLTLAHNLLRPNGSTIHRMAFDPRTGRPIGPVPGQGAGLGSTWARGQAWAVDGFAQAYALSRDERLLTAARAVADYWISRVPAGCVPAWDLDISSPTAPRDSSAAAIVSDGLLRLAQAETDVQRAQGYREYAEAMISTLLGPRWLPRAPDTIGLLHHQAYSVPADRREGTYVWGDSYLLSALSASGRQ